MKSSLAPALNWALRIILAVFYAGNALPKLQGSAGMVRRFSAWGYSEDFLLLIGLLEGLGGFSY